MIVKAVEDQFNDGQFINLPQNEIVEHETKVKAAFDALIKANKNGMQAKIPVVKKRLRK